MALYSVNTTARQEAVIVKILPIVNATRVASGQVALTQAQFLQRLLDDATSQYIKQDDDAESAQIGAAFTLATPTVRAAIKAQLGVV